MHNTGICCNAALKNNGFDQFFAFGQVTFKIPGNCKAQSCHDIVHRGGNLLQVDHIAFGKNTASSCYMWRVCRFKSQFPEFFLDRNPDAFCLLVEERACACCTDAVHRKIGQA